MSQLFGGRFGEKMVSGRRVLVGAKSQRFGGGSFWREDGFLDTCFGGSEVTAF